MPKVCEKLGAPDCPLALLSFGNQTVPCEPVQQAVVISAVREGFSPEGGQRLPKDDYMVAVMDASDATHESGAEACQGERTRMSGVVNRLLHELGVDVDLVSTGGKRVTELDLVSRLMRNGVFRPGQLRTLAKAGINTRVQEKI